MSRRSICLFCLSLSVFTVAAVAQTALGIITGIVNDPAGAVVAGATIEAKSTNSSQIYRAVSTETGNYTISQLPVGPYELSVTVAGFKKYTRQGLNLAAAQTMRIDIPLEVGTNTESVTVTAEASLLKTESGELTHNISSNQLEQLPVISVGGVGTNQTTGLRDPAALLKMIPGVNFNVNATIVVNGTPNGTTTALVEGMPAGMTTSAFKIFTDLGQAGVDAVQEAAVQTSNYAAEFGQVGGAVINYTMKSGTNQYHGVLFDYGVNEILNAAQPYTGLRSPTRRHDFGGTMGGPIRIPKLYDGRNKTFFFWNWEEFREDEVIKTVTSTVPTDAYRNGDFNQLIVGNQLNGQNRFIGIGGANFIDPLGRSIIAGQIFDPFTTHSGVVCSAAGTPVPTCATSGLTGSLFDVRDPFPGNKIPQNATYLDPVAQKILALVPRPTGPNSLAGQTGNNFQNPFTSSRVSTVPSLKIDHQVGSKGHFSFYGGTTGTDSQYSIPFGNADGFPTPITQARGTFEHAQTIRLNYDHTLTPTLLLHVGVGYSGEDFFDNAPVRNYDPFKELGLKGGTLIRQFPVITIGSAGVNFGGLSGGSGGLGPLVQSSTGSERRPEGNANASWVKRNHTFKAGMDARFERYPVVNTGNTAGNYSFAGTAFIGGGATDQPAITPTFSGLTNATIRGFAFANFLLGDVEALTLSQPTVTRQAKSEWGVFLQDNWKVTRKFTLDLGLRWDYGTYPREQYGRAAAFSATTPNENAGNHLGAAIFEATCHCTFADVYPYAIGPRVGLAYQINSKTVFRGGIGVVYNATGTTGGSIISGANAGTPAQFGGWVSQLKDGVPSSVAPVFPDFHPGVGFAPGSIGTNPTNLDRNSGRPARQLQWSVGIQREINHNFLVEASYVANRGVWWPASGLAPVNSMSVDLLAKYGFAVGDANGNLLQTLVPNLNAAQKSTLAQHGVGLPYAGFASLSSPSVLSSLLPFPQYNGNISPTSAPLGNTWYDSLQLLATKRLSRGLTFSANYTYSKNLDLMSSPDIFNRALGKNLSANDIPHLFRFQSQYVVPKLRATSGILSNKILKYALADWGMTWYLQYQSAGLVGPATVNVGLPATVTTNPISKWLGRGPGPAQQALDANGQPISPWSIDWTDYSGVHHTDPLDPNCHCFDPAKTVLLNPKAWVSVPDAQWAANQSSIRSFRGIRQPTENVGFSRDFRFKERVSLHLRVDFANAFNRTRLPAISLANFTTAASFPNGIPTGFGTMNPLSGTSGMRTGIFVARIQY